MCLPKVTFWELTGDNANLLFYVANESRGVTEAYICLGLCHKLQLRDDRELYTCNSPS